VTPIKARDALPLVIYKTEGDNTQLLLWKNSKKEWTAMGLFGSVYSCSPHMESIIVPTDLKAEDIGFVTLE
jgi:hypothetical protein